MNMNIHECIDGVRDHFYEADYLHLIYTLPVEAYSLNRELNYRLCDAWNRFEHRSHSRQLELTLRECILLAEAWYLAAPNHTEPMYVDAAWIPGCANCGVSFYGHHSHPENTPEGNPPDRWLCKDGHLYKAIEYKSPQFGDHPKNGA